MAPNDHGLNPDPCERPEGKTATPNRNAINFRDEVPSCKVPLPSF